MKIYWIFLFISCFVSSSYAQLIKEYKKMGDVAFSQGDYYNAIQSYKILIEKDTNRLDLNYSYAEACRYYHNYEEAIDVYARVIRQDKEIKYPLGYFWLADLYKTKQKYKKAKEVYEQFTSKYSESNDFYHKKATHETTALDTSIKINNIKPTGSIENLGIDINTSYSELSPYPISDSAFYFTSLRVRTDQIENNEALMENSFKVFKAIKENDTWYIDEDEKIMVNNPKFHIGSYVVEENNKRVFFTRCKSLNSSSVQCAIYTAEIGKDFELLNLHKLNEEVNQPGFTNTQPSVYIDEDGNKQLLFVSDRPGGLGKMDLWMCKIDKEAVAEKAVNLGSEINTPGNELTPSYFKRNNIIYFSSDWHPGLGGFDVFYTRYNVEEDEYLRPVNLGLPINSSYNELSFVMKKDSSGAFLASNRDDAFFINEEHCCHDLYDYNVQKKVKLEEVVEEPLYDTTQNILVLKGLVKDAKTKKKLTSEIELVNNSNGQILQKLKTAQGKGDFMVILPSGGNYGITASSPGYLFHSENLNIENAEGFKEINKEINLKRIEVGSSIILNNIFFDFDQSSLRDESFTELARLYELLINNINLIIEISGHTDNKGSRSYNKRLSLNRAKSVVDYLIEKGIDKKRLNYKGFGYDKPIADNETEEGRQMNRRTEFKIIGK